MAEGGCTLATIRVSIGARRFIKLLIDLLFHRPESRSALNFVGFLKGEALAAVATLDQVMFVFVRQRSS